MKLDRDLKTINLLRKLAASMRPGETLLISLHDSHSIRQIDQNGLVASQLCGLDRAKEIDQANQRGDFNELGLTLGGVNITLDNNADDALSDEPANG